MFKILKIGDQEPLSIKTFYKIVDRIDFFPVYQRYGNIWSLEKKRLLIDTIINGFDIPKFYFNYFVEENNVLNPTKSVYAVIDGKQRLQAILDFLNDKFPLDSEFVFYDNPDYNIRNLKFSEIALRYSTIADIIENYILDIVYVVTDEEDKLEDLFLRLNGGEALTNAEKRNAIGGELNRIIRNIVETNAFFTQKLKFKNPRYQHQDLLTKIAFIELNDALVTLGNSQLNEFVRSNRTRSNRLDTLITTVEDKIEEVSDIFYNEDPLLKGKGVIPVYYFFITHNHPDPIQFRDFLSQFENLRIANRRMAENEANPELIEYDRHNQQAVHTERSLIGRFEILKKYFDMFVTMGNLVSDRLDITNLDDPEE